MCVCVWDGVFVCGTRFSWRGKKNEDDLRFQRVGTFGDLLDKFVALAEKLKIQERRCVSAFFKGGGC